MSQQFIATLPPFRFLAAQEFGSEHFTALELHGGLTRGPFTQPGLQSWKVYMILTRL